MKQASCNQQVNDIDLRCGGTHLTVSPLTRFHSPKSRSFSLEYDAYRAPIQGKQLSTDINQEYPVGFLAGRRSYALAHMQQQTHAVE